MGLLFSTVPTESAKEMKSLLGFLDADIKFKNIRQEIITATNDVIDIIGKEVYEYAENNYEYNESPDEDDPDYQLIQAIRYPIAVNAYRLYAPNNDLAQTSNGRKMRNDDHEKAAFEWQIDRDNKAQEKRYYRALDDLIKFLDNSKVQNESAATIWTIWTSSDNYKASQKLFIRTTADFCEFYPIQSRYLLSMLAPGIAFCETREILPRIGKTKMDALKAKMQSAESITDETDLRLVSLIKEACAAYSLAWAIPRMSVQIFPEGIVQSYVSDRMSSQATKPAMMSEPESARHAFVSTFERVARDIEDLMKPVPEIPADLPIQPKIITGDKFFST